MKEKSFCFVVVKFQLIFGHPCTSVVCACIDFILVTSLRGADFRSCFIRERLMIYRVVSNDIREKSVAYRTKRTGPSTEPRGTPYRSCGGEVTKTSCWLKWTDICLRDMVETIGMQLSEWQKQNSGGGGEFGDQNLRNDPTKEEQNCCYCPERRECSLLYVTKRSRCCVLLDRLTERGCWGCFLRDGTEVCELRLFWGFLDRNGRLEMGR